MFAVEIYAAVRSFVFIKGNSRREAARVLGVSRETVLKMCRFSRPAGYTRTATVTKPKLGSLLPVIDAILAAGRTAPVKQRHTAKRIFERLRDEHGFAGGYVVVKDHVLAFVAAYNFAKHLKARRWDTPFQSIRDAWQRDPLPFKINQHHLTPGLNT